MCAERGGTERGDARAGSACEQGQRGAAGILHVSTALQDIDMQGARTEIGVLAVVCTRYDRVSVSN